MISSEETTFPKCQIKLWDSVMRMFPLNEQMIEKKQDVML